MDGGERYGIFTSDFVETYHKTQQQGVDDIDFEIIRDTNSCSLYEYSSVSMAMWSLGFFTLLNSPLKVGPRRAILKRRIIPFFVETFCDGNHPDHNRPCAMRVLHEIDCPHHRVAVRFSRE